LVTHGVIVPNTSVSSALLIPLLVPIAVVWIYHLSLRSYIGVGDAKRTASLLFTLVLIGVWGAAYAMLQLGIRDLLLVPVAALALAVVLWKREAFFPYRARCAR
jgi:hypothetical protein